jgi:hypothetical protein
LIVLIETKKLTETENKTRQDQDSWNFENRRLSWHVKTKIRGYQFHLDKSLEQNWVIHVKTLLTCWYSWLRYLCWCIQKIHFKTGRDFLRLLRIWLGFFSQSSLARLWRITFETSSYQKYHSRIFLTVWSRLLVETLKPNCRVSCLRLFLAVAGPKFNPVEASIPNYYYKIKVSALTRMGVCKVSFWKIWCYSIIKGLKSEIS